MYREAESQDVPRNIEEYLCTRNAKAVQEWKAILASATEFIDRTACDGERRASVRGTDARRAQMASFAVAQFMGEPEVAYFVVSAAIAHPHDKLSEAICKFYWVDLGAPSVINTADIRQLTMADAMLCTLQDSIADSVARCASAIAPFCRPSIAIADASSLKHRGPFATFCWLGVQSCDVAVEHKNADAQLALAKGNPVDARNAARLCARLRIDDLSGVWRNIRDAESKLDEYQSGGCLDIACRLGALYRAVSLRIGPDRPMYTTSDGIACGKVLVGFLTPVPP